jgi:AcrR family transcriptional regulator
MSPRSQTEATKEKATTNSPPRPRLNASRVIEEAVSLADEIGIDDLTIRRLATALDVKPMTIYHHVSNKEAIIDGMVDYVFDQVDLPQTDMGWRTAILLRSQSLRRVLAVHRWAPPLMEARTSPGPATLRHHDAVIGCFLGGGFSLEMTAHAYAVIDSYLYGYALQEANLPATGGEEMAELAASMAEQMPMDAYPYLAEFTAEVVLQPGYDFADEFEFGLGLILDGLAGSAEGLDS